jgi:hypothetical protein
MFMWNTKKSIVLSSVCTKIGIVLVVIMVVASIFPDQIVGSLAPLLDSKIYPLKILADILVSVLEPFPGMLVFFPVLFSAFAPVLTALFCIHSLISNIAKGRVFVQSNIRLLRVISWCCFAASAILVCACVAEAVVFAEIFAASSVPAQGTIILAAMVAAFVGMIVRVVKNVFAAAVELKDEHDYTI